MVALDEPAIAKGSVVLVVGANGLLGSHIADQLLKFGYKVRGSVRDPVKSAWMQSLFDSKYGHGNFEMVTVPDMTADGAFVEAVKGKTNRNEIGVSAMIHTAAVIVMVPETPDQVINPSIKGALEALKAAYTEPSIKRFVYTSSQAATKVPTPDKPHAIIDVDTFNDETVELARTVDSKDPFWGLWIYCAAKTLTERTVWDYYREHRKSRLDLDVNVVVPNMVFGDSVDPVNQGFPTSNGILANLSKGDTTLASIFPPEYYVSTGDIALLHIAAAIHPDVKGERVFGFAGFFNWDMILDILRKDHPEQQFPENLNQPDFTYEIKPRDRAEKLLRDLGRPGWTSLEDAVRMNWNSQQQASKR